VVIGVSGDSVKTHAAFKKEHMLTFTLLADEMGVLAGKFGVPFTKGVGKAKFNDQVFERQGTAKRWTVVIGADGTVVERYEVKDAAGDSKKILQIVEKLQTK
jgi:peroxiredoxin